MFDLPTGYSVVDVVPLGGAPGSWSYAVPPAFAGQATIGRRVLVPFGARRRAAIVLGPGIPPANAALREIEDVLDDEALVSPEVLNLARWAADYYGCPLSLALRAALPPGADADETRTPVLADAGRTALSSGTIPGTDRKALRAIEAGESHLLAPSALQRLVRSGLVRLDRTVSVGGRAPEIEIVVRLKEIPEPAIPPRFRSMHAVWSILCAEPRITFDRLQEQVGSARDAVKRLVKRGLVAVEHVPWSAARAITPLAVIPTLTDEQAQALSVLEAALARPEKRPYLLEGVTGSGKTEVYLRLIAGAREHGATALVLVPEIALTPQLASRFRARFGLDVAVLHSGLSDRERLAEWHRVRRGEATIVVGARSAVFAPLARPAVIIVDEEHDSSFKQADGLRYNGRDLAVVRGNLTHSLVVLGSATPSLETIYNAERERYGHLRLTRRVDARPMPEVSLIDLRQRTRTRPDAAVQPSDLLSEDLLQALRQTVERGEQSIVFLNRRGHSTILLCRDCGHACRCAQCSVSMTWHERRRQLVCHYCGARETAPDVCPKCESIRLLYAGAGTEKLEDELAAVLPGARIARLDRDTASTTQRLESLLDRFSAREIDILIGTQMVAKGHDFPGVTLVCVLLADSALHQPDFRSGERTAQLLNQVAGRAGRGDKPGRVLIQTFAPEAAAIRAALAHDYSTFARAELRERENAGYPPFRRLCLVRVDSEDAASASTEARRTAQALRGAETVALRVLGPAPMALARLRGRYRFQVLLKGERPADIHRALAVLREQPRPPAGTRIAIDVDPVDML